MCTFPIIKNGLENFLFVALFNSDNEEQPKELTDLARGKIDNKFIVSGANHGVRCLNGFKI